MPIGMKHQSLKLIIIPLAFMLRGIYSLSVCMFVCLSVHPYFVCRICIKVLRQSFSSGVYLSNFLSESIHIMNHSYLGGLAFDL